jgi:hypothetical protein
MLGIRNWQVALWWFILAAGSRLPAVFADDPPTIRAQGVLNLTFDETSGDGLDSATAGATQDRGLLLGGTARIRSPFGGPASNQAIYLDAAANQYVQIPHSADVSRPDAVTFSLFFANLMPPGDQAFHGIVAKRDDAKKITNYGINFSEKGDSIQLYINDGTGFKSAVYSLNAVAGRRKPVFLTAVVQVGDAPDPDADTDPDDVLLRLYANGKPITPKSTTGGQIVESDVWLTDIRVAALANEVPLTLGASAPGLEYTNCLIDDFSLFNKALTHQEVAKLYAEVAGLQANAPPAEEPKPVPAGPEITGLSLHGLTRGETTVVAVTGTNLLPDPQLVSTVPIEKRVLRPGATAERAEFEVTVAAAAPAGHYPIRVQTPRGISAVQPIAVDALPQVPFAESSPEKPVHLPVAISGSLTGQQQAKIFFSGKAGQRVLIDLECKRLGAAMDPVLELRNPRGAPLNIAWGRPQFRGDTRIEAHLFTDGIYILELHDLAFKAPGQNPFRLKIGDLKLIDTTLPPSVNVGTQRAVTAIGPGLDPTAALTVDMRQQLPGTIHSQGLSPESGVIGPGPSVIASGAVEVLEEPQSDGKIQVIDGKFAERSHMPIFVGGRIARHGETDKFVIEVTPGLSMNFSAESSAVHSPLEAHLEVRSHPDGNLLAASEEKPNLDFPVPAGVTTIQLAVSDLNHRGGADYVYRLRISRKGHADFSLALATDRVSVPRDANSVVRLDVNRTGYDGPITLGLVGAADISLTPIEIPAGASKALVVLTAKSPAASPGVIVRYLHLTGTSTGLNPALVRVANVPFNSRQLLIPAERATLTCTSVTSAPAQVEFAALPAMWFRGADLEIPIALKLQQPEFAKQAVRLLLLTTEAARTKADPTDPTQQKRLPIPLLRSLPEQTLLPGDTTGTMKIAVPFEAVEGDIDCVIRADFVPQPLSDNVQATIYSAPFRLPVQNALTLQLDSPILMLTGGAPTKLTGSVKRAGGFTTSVEVSVLNLPAGYTAPKVTVPGDQEKFEIVVTAPAATAAADLPNIQVHVSSLSGSLLQKDTPLATKVAPGP